jgi:hypothetical protein
MERSGDPFFAAEDAVGVCDAPGASGYDAADVRVRSAACAV